MSSSPSAPKLLVLHEWNRRQQRTSLTSCVSSSKWGFGMVRPSRRWTIADVDQQLGGVVSIGRLIVATLCLWGTASTQADAATPRILLVCKAYAILPPSMPTEHEIAIYGEVAEVDGDRYSLSETAAEFKLKIGRAHV